MIFVTVGLHKQGFDRLVKWADEIAGRTNENVFVQLGHTKYLPKYAKFFQFKAYQEIKELFRTANIVVTHGGVGSIMTALIYGKPVVAVPRLRRYGEAANDHQIDILNIFSKLGLVIEASSIGELEEAIRAINEGTAKLIHHSFGTERKKLIKFLELYLRDLEKKKGV